MKTPTRFLLTLVCVGLLGYASRGEANLISNGDFETGTFAGWTVVDRPGSFIPGSFFIDTPGTTTPVSAFLTAPNPLGGNFYAVSDQGGPGTHALLQTFVVPTSGAPVILAFDMFVNNQADVIFVNPAGLDHNAFPNQHARVDILTAGATAFDTGAGVLMNLFLGADPGPNPHPYTHHAFDITSAVGAGGTFQLRFAEVDNLFFFHLGVDNVSIEVVPEPTTLLLLGSGLMGLAGAAWRRHRRSSS